MHELSNDGEKPTTKIDRREFLRILALGGAAAVLAACAPQPTPAPTAAPVPTAVPPTSAPAATVAPTAVPKTRSQGPLNIDYWQDFNDEFKKALAGFKEATGIEVKHLPAKAFDQWEQEYTTKLAGKDDSVDIFFAPYTQVQRWGRAGWLADQTAIIQDGKIDLNDFVPNSVDGFKYKDKIYALPWGVDTELLAWRPSYFKEAGLTREPQTWDEVVSFGQKLTKEPDRYGLAVSYAKANALNEAEKWCAAAGGSVFQMDKPETKQALQFMKDLVAKKIAQPSAGQDAYGAIWQPFIDGKYAMWYMWDLWTGGLAKIEKLKGDVNFAWSPAGPKGVNTLANGWGFCINANSKKMDLVAEWIKYSASIPGMKNHAVRGGTPSRLSLWKDPEVQAQVPQLKWLVENQAKIKDYVSVRYQPIAAEIGDTISTNLSAYFTNQMSLDDLATKTMAAIRPLLTAEGYQFK